jgi:flagella basal body P-ring formation protein FlgA
MTYLLGVLLFPALLEAQPGQLSQRDPEIRAAVATYIQQKTEQLGYEVRIKKFSMGGSTELPEGHIDYEVVAPQQWEGWGNASIAVIARQGNRVVKNIPARVEVEALAEMVISVHQIDHGSVITAADVVLKKWDVSGIQGRYAGKIADVVGKKARTALRPNTPIKLDQLEKVALIKPGQAVTILAETGNMRITVTGRAKSAGAEGDMINVQNLDSLKEFPARIIDAKTVAIVF